VRVTDAEVVLAGPKPDELFTFKTEPGPEWRAAAAEAGTCMAVTGLIDLEDFDLPALLDRVDRGELPIAMVTVEHHDGVDG
jgi:hypothetical protein